MMKKTISLISVLFFIIALIVFINNKTREKWEQADKIYAIAHVTGKLSGTGPARDKYSYKINNTSYFGADYHLMQGSYYIIEVMLNDYNNHNLLIEKKVSPNDIFPQPPGGWTECPINEDGSIKEKYKRHKTKEQTEDNQISGVEFSAQDSVQVTKGSIEFLNKYKPQN